MFDRMWGKSVLKLLGKSSQVFQARKLTQREEAMVLAIALGFRENGFTKEMAADAIGRLVLKHGGLSKFFKAFEGNFVQHDDTDKSTFSEDTDDMAEEIARVSVGAAALAESASLPEADAIRNAQDFHNELKAHYGEKFALLSKEEKYNAYMVPLLELIRNELNPAYKFNPETQSFTTIAEQFGQLLTASRSLDMMAGAISDSLGMGASGADAIKQHTLTSGSRRARGGAGEEVEFDGIHESRILQRIEIQEAYPEPMCSWILSGTSVDKLERVAGDFGARNNPIPVNGHIGEIKYLSKLRTKLGNSHLCFHRTGSHDSDATERPVDSFDVVSLDGVFRRVLYFDFYHPRRSTSAPNGLYLHSVGGSGEKDAPWGYGVGYLLVDFPSALPEALVSEYGEEIGRPMAMELNGRLRAIEKIMAIENNHLDLGRDIAKGAHPAVDMEPVDLTWEERALARLFSSNDTLHEQAVLLTATQVKTLRSIAIGLKQKGMSEDTAAATLVKLSEKYESLSQLANRYSTEKRR